MKRYLILKVLGLRQGNYTISFPKTKGYTDSHYVHAEVEDEYIVFRLPPSSCKRFPKEVRINDTLFVYNLAGFFVENPVVWGKGKKKIIL